MATNYTVNYDDKRFTQVESDKSQALSDLEKTYAGMINNSDKYYQAQIDAAQNWADKQSQIQQEQTDFTIEQIEQQKAQAQKDYTKEQSGAYVDWQKQSNQYGANAEAMAAQGLAGSGFSESSQVSMYNTYQNRVATARESYNKAVLNYNNAIKDARLQNNAALAEIAYKALQTQLELSLEGFQYKNQLIIDKSNKKLEVDNVYHQRYQDVLNQINTENALAEEVRQFNQNYAMKEKEYQEGIRQFNEEIARLKAKDAQENKMEIQRLELQKAQLAEEKRQFNEQMAYQKAKSSGSGGGSSGGSSSVKKSSSGSSGKASNAAKIKSSKDNSAHYSTEKDRKTNAKKADYSYTYLNQLIATGASKDKVSNEISLALREGAITKAQATVLRNKFTPRGVQY